MMSLIKGFFGRHRPRTIHVGGNAQFIALIDAARYEGFIEDGEWGSGSKLVTHLRQQAQDLRVVLWSTGMERDWKVQVHIGAPSISVEQQRVGLIRASSEQLHLVNYDSLTMAAQFDDHRLPDEVTARYVIPVAAGNYLLTLQTLCEPGKLVNWDEIGFRVYLEPLDASALAQAIKKGIQPFVDDPLAGNPIDESSLPLIPSAGTMDVQALERLQAQDLLDVMNKMHPGWIRAFYRANADGPISSVGCTASYVMPEGAQLFSMMRERTGAFTRMNERSRELLHGKGQRTGVILIVVEADGRHSAHYEFEKMRRWGITKMHGGSGIPEGWKP
jgi:hypothetical protein